MNRRCATGTIECMMKAIVQDRYGPPDVLRLDDIDKPVPGSGEVLVRVRAATVNARDWHLMRGDPYVARLTLGISKPKRRVRGTDFAGTVEAVGPNVRWFGVGDEVYGEVHGAFAEYVCAPSGVVASKPAGLTFEQAAAVPLAANTALVALRDGLDSCIGCGCLSLQRCRLSNPEDWLSARGPGARILPRTLRE